MIMSFYTVQNQTGIVVQQNIKKFKQVNFIVRHSYSFGPSFPNQTD